MNKVPIASQLKIITKAFPKAKVELPKNFKSMAFYNANAEDEAVIPHWTLIGKTYNEAVQKVLDALKKSRLFYNWREGQIGPVYLKELPAKAQMLAQFKNKTFVIPVQTGNRWKGKSVETVRKEIQSGEVPLGAYEVGMILLTHPDRLEKYEDLWIDCAGDEYASDGDGQFVSAPVFDFGGGKLGFGAGWFSRAGGYCGAASGFLPQSGLETRSLEPLDLLTLSALEQRVEALEQTVGKLREALR